MYPEFNNARHRGRIKKKKEQVCHGCWKANADSIPTYTKSISQSSDLKVMRGGSCYFKAIVFFILEK